MIALSLGRCKPFLMMPSCDCRVSVATGTSKLQVQSLLLYPESDGRSSKCSLSRSTRLIDAIRMQSVSHAGDDGLCIAT